MTEHTTAKLAKALREIPGVPEDMIRRAGDGYYHDFLSPLDFPEIQLVKDLRDLASRPATPRNSRPLLREMAQRVTEGRAVPLAPRGRQVGTRVREMTGPVSAPWHTWGSGVVCAVTAQGENAGVLGVFGSPELAETACTEHNALRDLEWLAHAGFNVELSRRQHGRWRVSLQPAPDGWTAVCGQGSSPGRALAKAREWAEGKS